MFGIKFIPKIDLKISASIWFITRTDIVGGFFFVFLQ